MKYIVTREASIYLVVEAQNESEAMEKAFDEYDLDDYEFESASDDATVEEYEY